MNRLNGDRKVVTVKECRRNENCGSVAVQPVQVELQVLISCVLNE